MKTADMNTLKTRPKATWESGDYGVFAKYLEKGALETGGNDLTITRHMYPFEYPLPRAKVVDVFVEYYGPTNRAYASLNGDGRKALHDDLTALWILNNTARDGTTRVAAEYIEVVGTRASVGSSRSGSADTGGAGVRSSRELIDV